MGNSQQIPEYQYGFFRTDVPAKPGHSTDLISYHNKDNPGEVTQAVFNGCSTIQQGYRKTLEERGNELFLGTRNKTKEGLPYEWLTYRQVDEMAENIARGLVVLDMISKIYEENMKGDMKVVGIYSKNRAEWCITELACVRQAVTVVPFFDSLGVDALAFVLSQTKLKTMFVDAGGLKNLIKLKEEGKAHALEIIVSYDDFDTETKGKVEEKGLKLYHYKEVSEEGKKSDPIEFEESTPETNVIICYTSGTTGDPKGSLISNEYMIGIMRDLEFVECNLGPTDVALSYLPMAHIFEQAFFLVAIFFGMKSGFYQGDPTKIFDDIQALKPSVLLTVPRILNRIYSKVQDEVGKKGAFSRWLFHRGISSKYFYLQQQGVFNHGFYDKMIFSKIKGMFGGRLRILVTGSAPISPEIMTFFKVALSIHVYDLYGQTEAGIVTVTHPKDPVSGHAGGVVPSTICRLRDLPELEYLHTDKPYPRGELQYKGCHTIKGYFNNMEKTHELRDEDGYINSGDVAMVYPNGAIKIFDRAKNIFKLSQGEYIAPEKLENIYTQCSGIGQMWVYGDSFQSFLVAIIVPNPDFLKDYTAAHGKEGQTPQDIIQTKEFQTELQNQMKRKEDECKLSGLEKVRKFHLVLEAFSVDNGLLTPTFKIRRNIAKNTFDEQIKQMYAGVTL